MTKKMTKAELAQKEEERKAKHREASRASYQRRKAAKAAEHSGGGQDNWQMPSKPAASHLAVARHGDSLILLIDGDVLNVTPDQLFTLITDWAISHGAERRRGTPDQTH